MPALKLTAVERAREREREGGANQTIKTAAMFWKWNLPAREHSQKHRTAGLEDASMNPTPWFAEETVER